MSSASGHLIVLGGLPGSGKTTLGRALATALQAVYLRIDSIEHALDTCGQPVDGPEGYVIAYAVAEDNLRLGRVVIGDSVNPLPRTRHDWQAVGAMTGVPVTEIEVVCSDPAEHRRRVEERRATTPPGAGHCPTWEEVQERTYHPWTPAPGQAAPLIIDTAGRPVEDTVAEVLRALG